MFAKCLRQITAILLIALVPALVLVLKTNRMRVESLGAGEISPLAAKQHSGIPIQYVDARSREEFSRGHAPGAVLLNAEEWESLIAGFYDSWAPGTMIVVYGKARSDEPASVAHRLRIESGLDNIFVLKGIWEECQ